MKLFYAKGACSLTVRIILNELNTPFTDEAVDLRAKKTASGANYWEINPKGSVPAIQLDNGQILTETQVILQFLADNQPGTTLFAPVGAIKRYRIMEWLNFVSTELHKALGGLFNPNLTPEMKNNITIPLVNQRFKLLNQHLQHQTFLMGDQFTLPDAYLYLVMRWANYFQLDLTAYPNLLAYIERVSQRESVQKALKQEGF